MDLVGEVDLVRWIWSVMCVHLLDKMVEFFGRGLADKVLSFGRVADGVVVGDRLGANVLIEVAFWHDGLRANR